MEKRGIDTLNPISVAQELARLDLPVSDKIVQDITGQIPDSPSQRNKFCNSDMIQNYVQKLNIQSDKPKPVDVFKIRKRPMKNVYTVCATFNNELNFLAVSFIDQRIKIYKGNQNGLKFRFEEWGQLYSKFIVTCMSIARAVSNSKPILVMGSKCGHIEIYYLDSNN